MQSKKHGAYRVVVVFIALFLAAVSPAETLKERVDRLWADFVKSSDSSDLLAWRLPELTATIQQLDFTSDPGMREPLFQKMYERLEVLLKELRDNEYRTGGGIARSKTVRDIFESLILLAPYCGAEVVKPLIHAATDHKKLSLAALTTLASLAELNDTVRGAITETQRKAIVASAELLRLDHELAIKFATPGKNISYPKRMIARIERTLRVFVVEWSRLEKERSSREEASRAKREVTLLLVLISSEWKLVTVAVDELGQLGALSDTALRSLQGFIKREELPQDIKVKALELLRSNIHARFANLLSRLPGDLNKAQTLVDGCLGLLLEAGDGEELL